jgi:hypothetical protein
VRSLLAMNGLLLTAFLWRGCGSDFKPAPKPLPSADGGAAGSPAGGGGGGTGGQAPACERACRRLAELGCSEAQPTQCGVSCVDVCENVEGSGILSLDPECVARIHSCAEVDACGNASP